MLVEQHAQLCGDTAVQGNRLRQQCWKRFVRTAFSGKTLQSNPAKFSMSLPASHRQTYTMLGQRTHATVQSYDNDILVKGGMHPNRGTALADLTERGGFLPRPDVFDEKLKPGFRGGRALFVFFFCNAVPFGAVLYYFREQRTQRTQMSLLALPRGADEVAAEALRVVRTASTCFLMQGGVRQGATVRIDPHLPEGAAYVPPTEPLPLVPQMERSAITDIFESPSVPGLKYVHFALSRASAAAAPILAGERQASLLYISNTRGAYCTVSGQLSILIDAESRRRYWRSLWTASFPACEPEKAGSALEPSSQWQHGDYMLIRLSVSEVALQAAVDGPQRWQEQRVQLLDSVVGEQAGTRWAVVTSDVPRAV